MSGVSVSTVSLVLNGKGNISRSVRARVIATAQELGYLKNIHASSMASQRSSHIAVLVNESYEKAFEWFLVRNIIMPIEATITQQNYYPILIPVTLNHSTWEIVKKVQMSGAGGVFAIHFGSRELFVQLEDRGIPVVLLNHSPYAQEFHSVTADALYGSFQATKHLLDKGHRHLVYADYTRPDVPGIVFDRGAGFQKAISEYQGGIDATELTAHSVDSNEHVHEVAKRILEEKGAAPIAVVAHDDYFAAKLYAYWSHEGFKVPDDISLIAPGDTLDYALPFIPPISTMQIDTKLMGTLAGEMMLRRLAGESDSVEALKVQHAFRERGSCDRKSEVGHV